MIMRRTRMLLSWSYSRFFSTSNPVTLQVHLKPMHPTSPVNILSECIFKCCRICPDIADNKIQMKAMQPTCVVHCTHFIVLMGALTDALQLVSSTWR